MLRKLQEILSQLQFDGQLLDQKREDVYMLMHQQVSSLR